MPKMMSRRTGSTSANSTAAAPRSLRRFTLIDVDLFASAGDGVVAEVEEVVDGTSQKRDPDDDGHRDKDREKGVLSGHRASVAASPAHTVLPSRAQRARRSRRPAGTSGAGGASQGTDQL